MNFLISLMMTFFFSSNGYATFLPTPEIFCSPSSVRDAGYNFTIIQRNKRFLGSMERISFRGNSSLGEEEVLVSSTQSEGKCSIVITQAQDLDDNKMKLEINDASPGGESRGSLNMKLNGLHINEAFRSMSCYIDQYSFNNLCHPNYSREGME